MPFPIGCERKASQNIFVGQVIEVFEDFLLGHPRRKIAQDIIDSYPHSSDARFAAPFTGFNGYNLLVAWVHLTALGLFVFSFYYNLIVPYCLLPSHSVSGIL
jgi:hypothetical protein